ncbi:uncharacterized protein B0I36DRAFT_75718 [Microdochium trichocladiopsis]|uniref:Uncharacterized protein n=1 Tax=Microdochium trichocladiopsis TaxID=1682393 RepID=A0A9P8YES5_9PEZI|nr:uncharacterized protein B0I36DRAFT_75718 [Microdochium trichocladiopsis]KAH7038120.1 hypothetical protein B0I36DRAFT_75718 [Microdochium trichocladiopsis]
MICCPPHDTRGRTRGPGSPLAPSHEILRLGQHPVYTEGRIQPRSPQSFDNSIPPSPPPPPSLNRSYEHLLLLEQSPRLIRACGNGSIYGLCPVTSRASQWALSTFSGFKVQTTFSRTSCREGSAILTSSPSYFAALAQYTDREKREASEFKGPYGWQERRPIDR